MGLVRPTRSHFAPASRARVIRIPSCMSRGCTRVCVMYRGARIQTLSRHLAEHAAGTDRRDPRSIHGVQRISNVVKYLEREREKEGGGKPSGKIITHA